MKASEKKELRSKTVDELIKELKDLKSEVAKMSIDMKTGKIEDLNKLYRKRKDIARVMTYLSIKTKTEIKEDKVQTV